MNRSNRSKSIFCQEERGRLDVIGDVHGCYDELCDMLEKLGYSVDRGGHDAGPPEGRRAAFVGDLCDRGPDSIGALRLVMNMAGKGDAYCVIGNHDAAVLKKLCGLEPELPHHGLDETLAQLGGESDGFVAEVKAFLSGLASHHVFFDGGLVVAHAGLSEKYHGRTGAKVLEFCLYGDISGEVDDKGRYVHRPWEDEYRGRAAVIYGHLPKPEVKETNNTWCIDTGCVYGGKLTCMRYPEMEIVQVNAARVYYDPKTPISKNSAK